MNEVDWPELIRTHGGEVWRCAYRLVGNQADAADCAQETFLAAYRTASHHSIEHWSAYLRRLATTKAVDLLRQRARNNVLKKGLAENMSDSSVDPAAHAIASELSERLRFCIAKLPDSQANVFCLRILEEMTYEETAAQLGLTTNAVGVLLHKARTRLREMLADELIGKGQSR